tara:strand:+ start:429 stop:812 length:384 start_codon:yes stop_codon:yes gene_type:complete
MNKINLPSNRSFGIVFFVVFLIISLLPLISGHEIRIWSLLISLVFLTLGILNSKILLPLNRYWTIFGLFIGNIISPLIMGIIYFGVITPTGLLMKIFGKDLLGLKKNKNNSYWIKKDNTNNNMKNQF